MTRDYTESEARAIFEERMRMVREMLDALPRKVARVLPPEKRFQAERRARIQVEKFLAQQPTFEQFVAKIRERAE